MLLMGGDLRNRPGQGLSAKRPVGPQHKPITMRTLGDFQRSAGYMLWASCPSCGRYRTLDLNALAQRPGRPPQAVPPLHELRPSGTALDRLHGRTRAARAAAAGAVGRQHVRPLQHHDPR